MLVSGIDGNRANESLESFTRLWTNLNTLNEEIKIYTLYIVAFGDEMYSLVMFVIWIGQYKSVSYKQKFNNSLSNDISIIIQL